MNTTDQRSANRPKTRYLMAIIIASAGGAITVSPGWAQMIGNGPIGQSSRIGTPRSSQGTDKPQLPEPDAIPGSKARLPAAAPTHAPTDLQPTDALFDAINRGDIAAARDALNRGADMNGINILGMTPMELSVDLGRNDISFLLLSMRGEDTGRGSRAVGRDTASASRQSERDVPALPSQKAGVRPVPANRSKLAAEKPVASKPASSPRLFANDGGTPLPNAGFLGFDATRAAN